MAIQSRAKTNDITEKLRAASSFLEYYVDGAYAAYQYHRHSAAASMGISVKPDQLPKWIALISEPKVALSIDDVPAEKSGQTNVHLHSDFDEELSEHTRIINGVKFLSPEILVVSGINVEGLPLKTRSQFLWSNVPNSTGRSCLTSRKHTTQHGSSDAYLMS